MSRFRSAHASGNDWESCVARCVATLGKPAGTLGFVYFTEALMPHAGEIVATLRELTGVPDWTGTVGLGILANGVEYLDEPAIVVMVADLSQDSYSVFSGKKRAPTAGERTPAGAVAAHFAVVHGDPRTPDMAELIADMAAKLESGYLVGGLSSASQETVQVANDVLSGGLSGVVFASDVPVATRLTQGCTPLPARHRVTECEDNILVSLDNRPALDVFKEDIGEVLARDLRRAAHFMHVGLPVRGSDTGDYLVRNLVGLDPKNGLIAVGEAMEVGDELFFCKRDAQTAREDLERMLAALKTEVPAPRGALYYSCLGRGEHMFGRRGAEMEIIREALGDVPLAGFFCNGEISHDRLYGYTGVLTLFR